MTTSKASTRAASASVYSRSACAFSSVAGTFSSFMAKALRKGVEWNPHSTKVPVAAQFSEVEHG